MKMNENIIKKYIINKVKMIVENFIETTVWQVDRLFISAIKEEYLWSVTSCNGTLSRIGFRFMEPNKLSFYEFNHWGEEINCFVWEFPNIIVDAPSHPMCASSLMRELWRHIHRTMMNTNIQSDYNSFLASINQKPKLNLNAQYGLTTIPIHEAAARVVADAIKAAGDSLLCQSWHRYPGQEDDINCILNGPKEENNMFAEIKTYVADKVVNLIEKFIGGACDDVVKRFVSPAKDDFWWAVTWNNGRFTRFGFRFDDAPNTLMFYELDGYSRKTNCYLWEYPHRIIDVSPHPTMTGALMRELWEFINWVITMTKIQSKYERFISSVTHGERYKYLNALYGSTSMSLDEETKKANILKGLSEALGMPIITSSQTFKLSSYNKEEIYMTIPEIKNVFFNEVKKTTTVVFNDHTSIIVKCTDNDRFDPEVGLAMALTKKLVGSRAKFQKLVDEWVANSAPKNEQLKKKAARKAEKEAAKIEHAKAQAESYME
jgi:hypothetical protein